MPGILTMIFRPYDGSRRKVRDDAATARQDVEKAANRLEKTIRDLLERNDELTGRVHEHNQSSK